MKTTRHLMILFMLIMTMAGCTMSGQKAVTGAGVKEGTEKESDYVMRPIEGHKTRKVIIDTDTGADDASAIILTAKQDSVDLLGVTVLAGNVDLEQGTKNALMALEMAGVNVPVFKGAAESLDGKTIETVSVFGEDGMGAADLIHPKLAAEEKDAIDFILDTVNQYPNEVEIFVLGPATNIAKAVERDPETMKKVKMIWSMGTTGLGPGNASPVAEFNVYKDPAAYKVMLDSGMDITIVGVDVCSSETYWTDAQFERLEQLNDVGKFVTASFGKLREFYASNGSAGAVMNADGLAAMCALYPDFVKETVKCHASCITAPGETFGQVIFYRKGFTYDAVSNDFDYNVTLVSRVDENCYFETYRAAIK